MSQTTGTDQPSQAIASNPKHIPDGEGIWYVIQNKEQVDQDSGEPATRTALRGALQSTSGQVSAELAPIPLTGDYDSFLWRVEVVDSAQGTYKLINKKDANSLSSGGQEVWSIDRMDLQKMGTNAYYLRNPASQALRLSAAGEPTITATVAASTSQTWLFQPMGLVAGYHIPESPQTIPTHQPSPSDTVETGDFTKTLAMDNGLTIFATETTSDWAILNVHNIHTNMMNALKADNQTKMAAYAANARKEVLISSRFDGNAAFANYPLASVAYDEQYAGEKRGGVANYPDAPHHFFLTWVTEEMMCKTGVVNKVYEDTDYREFDQVVHEFVHTIDVACGLDAKSHEDNPLKNDSNLSHLAEEWFPDKVQMWFNSMHRVANQNRQFFETHYPAQEVEFVKTVFDEDNTWLPPRRLRDHPFNVPTATLKAKSENIQSRFLFGWAVAISQDGETAVVGAPNRGSGNNQKGSVSLFDRTDAGWKPVTPEPGDDVTKYWFGWSVAVNREGDTALVGAPRYPSQAEDHGAVYIFGRDPVDSGNWGEVGAPLTATDGSKSDLKNTWFGSSVAIRGNTIVVGVPDSERTAKSNRAGSVYIFQRSGQSAPWEYKWELTAPVDQAAQSSENKTDGFGNSVAISDDEKTVVVGAPDKGYVFVFRRTSATDPFDAGAKVNDSGMSGLFGHAVAFGEIEPTPGQKEEVVVVGAPGTCKAFAYNLTSDTDEELLGDDHALGEMYGWSVAIGGDTIIVGARLDRHSGTRFAGSASVFRYRDGAWSRDRTLQLNTPGEDSFGLSVAVSQNENAFVVGAPGTDVEVTNGSTRTVDHAGVVHIYEL